MFGASGNFSNSSALLHEFAQLTSFSVFAHQFEPAALVQPEPPQ
jgi:hypothetical protein